MKRIGKIVVSTLTALLVYFSGCEQANETVRLDNKYTCTKKETSIQLYKDGRLVASKSACNQDPENKILCFYENGRRFAEFMSGQCKLKTTSSQNIDEMYSKARTLERKLLQCEARF